MKNHGHYIIKHLYQGLLWIFTLALVLGACKKADISEDVNNVQSAFIPDRRLDFFEARLESISGQEVLRGETNLAAAKDSLLQLLKVRDIQFIDSLEVLPNTDFDKGIVNVSVANIRGQAKHSSELVTQAILGTPVVVFKEDDGWYYIQTPDRYLGWTNVESIKTMDDMAFENWQIIPKLMVTADVTTGYSGPSKASPATSDLVLGSVLQFKGKDGAFVKVGYPDRRLGYVPSGDLQFFDKWLSNVATNSDNVLQTAQRFIGRPYLWGGASPYGFDCSGFTKIVYGQNGVLLPRDASQQVLVGKAVDTDNTLKHCEKGDLLFFGKKGIIGQKNKVTHVAIYMGEGRVIHATGDVKIESLWPDDELYNQHRHNTFLTARRIIGHSENLSSINDVYSK